MQEMLREGERRTFCHPILCHDEGRMVNLKECVMDVTPCTTIVQIQNLLVRWRKNRSVVSRSSKFHPG